MTHTYRVCGGDAGDAGGEVYDINREGSLGVGGGLAPPMFY
jgi:hypothetical protein